MVSFKVTADTLDPRTDTETIITAILEKYETRRAESSIFWILAREQDVWRLQQQIYLQMQM